MSRPVIDEAAFSGPLGEITLALDPFTEADPVGVLTSLLAAFSARIGRGPKVTSMAGPSVLSFWPVLVGQTGLGRKGTATNLAMRVVESAWSIWAEENVVGDGLPATGLGYVEMLQEAVGEDGKPRPRLFVEEEADNLVTNTKRDRRFGTHLRKSWDGKGLLHRTAKDSITVKDPHVAIIVHAQPKNWGSISGSKDASGGTFNRFFPVFVERSKTLPVFSANDPSEVIREMGKKLRKASRDAADVDLVAVRDDVAVEFEKKHRPAVEALIKGNEELAQMAERALAYLIRLAGLYALTEGRDEIEVKDFDAALALVKYSVETVVMVLPDTGGDRLHTKIWKYLKMSDGPVSKKELYTAVGNNYSKEEMNAAILSLSNVRRFKKAEPGKLGRPPEWFELVELVEEDEGEKVSA